MKKFDFEQKFTQAEYEKFLAAVGKRERYEFRYGEHKDKVQVVIDGRVCDNGVWAPENYLWGINTHDKRGGYSGTGRGFRVGDMKTRDEIIDYVYEKFGIERPQQKQLSFL